jgi:branched-chain amino acid transport system ATP-binding protein
MLLELRDVHASYGGRVKALHGVSLGFQEGEVVALIGANGAGKSALLRVISGLIQLDGGEILFEGRPLNGLPAHEIVSLGITQVPEGRRVFPQLTVEENLDLGAFSVRDSQKVEETRERVYRMFRVLDSRRRQLAGTLSGGEQQMLAIGRALMARPRFLMLDEPSMGLAPLVVEKIFETIRQINAEGVTILLVEQNARAALALASRGYVLETGRVVLSDSSPRLLINSDVKRAYLGV